MKRIHWLVIIPVLAVVAYFASRRMSHKEPMQVHPSPGAEEMAMPATAKDGLLWLKSEFKLSDADYDRISNLHDAYLPGCMERCRDIARVRRELFALIQENKSVTAELKAKLEESGHQRAECSAMMLAHFYEVAAAMPPPAAKRYLEWVTSQTLMD